VTSRNGDADPTVVGLSRELPAPPRLAAVPADANGGATDDEGAASHPPVVDDGQEEDETAADGGREKETPSSATLDQMVDCPADEDDDKDGSTDEEDSTDTDGGDEDGSADTDDDDEDASADADDDKKKGSGDADDKEGGSRDADGQKKGSGDADDKEGGSGDADDKKGGSGDADDNEDSEGICESDLDVSDMVDADEGAATANDPMQVDPREDGVATGCGTFAGSVNGVVEDGGKGGDDQHDGVGVDMGGVVDGGDANRAAGWVGGAIVPACWRVGLMTWAHSHGGVAATANGPLWAPLYSLGRTQCVCRTTVKNTHADRLVC